MTQPAEPVAYELDHLIQDIEGMHAFIEKISENYPEIVAPELMRRVNEQYIRMATFALSLKDLMLQPAERAESESEDLNEGGSDDDDTETSSEDDEAETSSVKTE